MCSFTFYMFCVLQSDAGSAGSAPLSPVGLRRSHEDYTHPLQLHGGIRRLQRTLSEDNKRRRDSMPSTPLGAPPNLGAMPIPSPSPISHSKSCLRISMHNMPSMLLLILGVFLYVTRWEIMSSTYLGAMPVPCPSPLSHSKYVASIAVLISV
jgi:hypothetical protein